MLPDPDIKNYEKIWREHYQKRNYETGVAAWFMNQSHTWAEKKFTKDDYFSKVLEIGAGGSIHLQHVRHKYDEYILSDIDEIFLEKNLPASKKDKISVKREDATCLTFENNSVDRLIASHVLEHLADPHLVLREWYRVVKPNGIMTIVLPCDPGMAWRLGRNFGPRSSAKNVGIEYNYWMAREHINSITNLIALIRYYFTRREEYWRPFFVPNIDINLFYICHLEVQK